MYIAPSKRTYLFQQRDRKWVGREQACSQLKRLHVRISLEILIFDELNNDVLLRLDLQHLQR